MATQTTQVIPPAHVGQIGIDFAQSFLGTQGLDESPFYVDPASWTGQDFVAAQDPLITQAQGMVGGLDEETILKVHDNFCYKKYPDLTLLLDVNPEIGLARKNKITLVENRFENFKDEFHELVQKKFLELAGKYDNRYRVINADNNKDFIFNEIIDQIKHFFSVTL